MERVSCLTSQSSGAKRSPLGLAGAGRRAWCCRAGARRRSAWSRRRSRAMVMVMRRGVWRLSIGLPSFLCPVLCPVLGRWAASRCRCPDFPDFPRLWGKRVRAGDVRERQRASLYELGDSGRRLAGVGRGPGGRSGCALVLGATHCGVPATTRSTICINSTKKGSVTTARHAPARAGHTTAEGVESTLGPVCGLGLALQSCNPALKVLADPAVLVLVVVARWILYRGLDSPCQRGDVPSCWPPESKNAMERGVEDGGEVEGGSETQRDADAEMQRCRVQSAECRGEEQKRRRCRGVLAERNVSRSVLGGEAEA